MINTDFFELCHAVFSYCIEFWNISTSQMQELVAKYKLASYVLKEDDLLQLYGPGSIADIIEEHINSLGGTVRHGE